jgi:hypothetical protein
MGFLIFFVILFGSMGYGAYYLIDFFFPMFFQSILPFLPAFVWSGVLGTMVAGGLSILFGKGRED